MPAIAAGTGTVPWDPTRLHPRPIIWLDASDPQTILLSAGTNKVISWVNKGRAGPVLFTQGTDGKRPLWGTRYASNGLPVVDFDGTDDFLSVAGITIAKYWSVFAVVLTDTTSGVQNIVDGDNFPGTRLAQFLRFNATGTVVESIAFNTTPAAFTDAAGTTFAASIPYVLSSVHEDASVEVFLNGKGNGATTTTGTPQSGSIIPSIGCTAATGTPAGFLNGWVGEVLLFDFPVPWWRRQQIESYLGAKWAAQLAFSACSPLLVVA